MRRLIPIAITVLLLVSLFAVSAGAENGQAAVISGTQLTEYADYKDAFKAAQPGDTILLLKDITLYGNESLTLTGGSDLTVDGNGFTIFSPYTCFYCPAASESSRTKLSLKNLKINCTEIDGKHAVWVRGNVDLEIDNCYFRSSHDGIKSEGAYNNIVMRDSEIFSENRYGVQANNASTYYFENTKIESSVGSCIEVIPGSAPGAELTIKNCDFKGNGNYCLWLQSLAKATIEGGTYTTVGNDNKIAAVMIEGNDCELTIKDGTFSCDHTSAVSLFSRDDSCVLTIEGGTFIYTGGGEGSALLAGGINPLSWRECGGILNISGGNFISNGTGPVVDVGNDRVSATLTSATFTNSGAASVPAYSKNGKALVSFPSGQKTVSFPLPEPITTPVQTEPVTTPEQSEPVTTPEQSEPVTTPEQSKPVTTPEQSEPVTTPEQSEPVTTPEQSEPVTTPGQTEPETTPGQTEPETTPSPSGKKGCGGFAEAGFILIALAGASAFIQRKR